MTSQRLEPSFLLTKEGPSVIFGYDDVITDVRVGAESVRQVGVGGEVLAFSDSLFPCDPCPLGTPSATPNTPRGRRVACVDEQLRQTSNTGIVVLASGTAQSVCVDVNSSSAVKSTATC